MLKRYFFPNPESFHRICQKIIYEYVCWTKPFSKWRKEKLNNNRTIGLAKNNYILLKEL